MLTTEDKLKALLPERNDAPRSTEKKIVSEAINTHAEKLRNREQLANARKLLAKAKYYKNKYGNPEGYEPEFDEDGNFIEPLYDPRKVDGIINPKTVTTKDDVRIVQQPIVNPEEAQVMFTGQYAHLNSTSSPYIQKLLHSLNIDETVKLSKTDLSDLLSTVMMMNEDQLNGMMKDKKIPVVIRILIRALYNDMRIGNLDTLDKLWDRIFGKPSQHQTVEDSRVSILSEVLPGVQNGPVSREAYILIKDKLLGDK